MEILGMDFVELRQDLGSHGASEEDTTHPRTIRMLTRELQNSEQLRIERTPARPIWRQEERMGRVTDQPAAFKATSGLSAMLTQTCTCGAPR